MISIFYIHTHTRLKIIITTFIDYNYTNLQGFLIIFIQRQGFLIISYTEAGVPYNLYTEVS